MAPAQATTATTVEAGTTEPKNPSGLKGPYGTSPLGTSGPALVVEGLSTWLSGREVLHDVSFSVAPGELTGLIGMNGAGKTTLLRCILGLQPMASGKVIVAGGRSGRRATGTSWRMVARDTNGTPHPATWRSIFGQIPDLGLDDS